MVVFIHSLLLTGYVSARTRLNLRSQLKLALVTDTEASRPPFAAVTLYYSVGGWVGSVLHTTAVIPCTIKLRAREVDPWKFLLAR